jgi:uncharacterized protein (TIGR00251 family)
VTAEDRAELLVRVQPRASRTELAGERDGRLLIRVTAAPVEGKANAVVRALLAKRLRVPRGSVRIASGQTGRDKRVIVEGLSTAEAQRRLA